MKKLYIQCATPGQKVIYDINADRPFRTVRQALSQESLNAIRNVRRVLK